MKFCEVFLWHFSMLQIAASLRCTNDRNDTPPIYWINLEKSFNRRNYFEKEMMKMGYRNHRVRAIALKSLRVMVGMGCTRENTLIE